MNYVQRVGIGYDFHQILRADNATIPICGTILPSNFTVQAHSDGDVGLHALTDAMLGAIAHGNIGTHFPNTDAKWYNVNSKVFVQHAHGLIKQLEGKIINIDITIICEFPKIMPYNLQMRQTIADMLAMHINQISVKAVTTEKMGFLGRGEGIAAQAICNILMPYLE